jgi:hypothetical protein
VEIIVGSYMPGALRADEDYLRVSMGVHRIGLIDLQIEMLRTDIWALDIAERRSVLRAASNDK